VRRHLTLGGAGLEPPGGASAASAPTYDAETAGSYWAAGKTPEVQMK
jgi:hypothetical protein